MPSLRELQYEFAAAIIGEDAARMRAHVVARASAAATDAAIGVYLDNTHANLREALRDVFPVIERLVGEAFFRHAANRFIRDTPSTSGDLHRFGDAFPAYLATFAPAASLPYLADTARLEWAMHEVFHALAHAPLSLAQLQQLQQLAGSGCATLRFALNPACRLVASHYPVLRIWEMNQPGAPEDATLDARSGGEHVLVRQSRLAVEAERLDAASFAMLETLARGATVEHAYDAALATDAGFALGAFLRQRILDATLVGFKPSLHSPADATGS
jgi:hypothetical protein